MPDNLDRYIPEFDEDDARAKLAGSSREELTGMLIYAYKLRRLITKTAEEDTAKPAPNSRQSVRAFETSVHARCTYR